MVVAMKKLLVGALLLLAVAQITADPHHQGFYAVQTRSARQSSNNEGGLTEIASMLTRLPIVGTIVQRVLEAMSQGVENLNILSNGMISRFLGGTLPCIVSRENGITCKGISEKGGIYAFFENFIKDMPGLPDFAKAAILMFIRSVVNPLVDTMLGGVPSGEVRSHLLQRMLH